MYFETEAINSKLSYNLFFPKMNEKENMECGKFITKSECFKAVSELSNNKSPGLDGFSIKFYKTFWKDFERNISKMC